MKAYYMKLRQAFIQKPGVWRFSELLVLCPFPTNPQLEGIFDPIEDVG